MAIVSQRRKFSLLGFFLCLVVGSVYLQTHFYGGLTEHHEMGKVTAANGHKHEIPNAAVHASDKDREALGNIVVRHDADPRVPKDLPSTSKTINDIVVASKVIDSRLAGEKAPLSRAAAPCSPQIKIVFLKTHKTGSSTLTNIFHRAALRYDARVVLPKSNLFLGWPSKQRISESYERSSDIDTYDIFCSAHARYDYARINRIVPDAKHITVLREPASHFVSSWNYWNTASHIKAISGMDVTMEQVLDDPVTWWPRAFRSDKDLLVNSQSFDLGIDHTATEAAVDAMIATMDHWGMVLITEHMDESLVLLRRRLCWDLRDIAYFSLKVNSAKKKAQISPETKRKIYTMNWMDTKLYNHFNRSLWIAIGHEANFAEEVAELKREKTAIMHTCECWAPLEEDQHRKRLLGERGEIDALERRCHLLQLDSGGFVKYLKKVAGIGPKECHRQGRPLKAFVYVPVKHGASEPVLTALHRYTYRNGLRPAIPANASSFTFGYPDAQRLPSAVANIPQALFQIAQPGTGRQTFGFDVLVSAPFRFEPTAVDQVVKNPPTVTMLRDPVEQFLATWHSSEWQQRRAQWPRDIPLNEFLAHPATAMQALSKADTQELFNAQAFALGHNVGGAEAPGHFVDRVLAVGAPFTAVLIAEHMDVSLVFLRRVMCWDLDFIAHPYTPPPILAGALTTSEIEAIRLLNPVDVLLYEKANRSFWERLDTEISVQDEIDALHKIRRYNIDTCGPWSSQQPHQHLEVLKRKHAAGMPFVATTGDVELECRLQHVSTRGFAAFFAHLWNIQVQGTFDFFDDKSSAIDERPRRGGTTGDVSCMAVTQFIFLKTHKTASSTLTNIFHRFVLKHRLRAVLPIDNMYLGWPTRAGALKSYIPIPGVHTYDFFGSGHATWSSEYIRKLVPVGKQLTVMREPVAQFISSWHHWHTDEHIVSMGGPKVTLDQFLDQPDKYWKYAKWSDEALLHNSYAYDFGITSQPTPTNVATILTALRDDFDLILLTEHLDESLVLMRRLLCWDFEDIVYFSLKVNGEKKNSHVATPNQRRKIMDMNYADVAMYAYANQSFWDRISTEGPDFYAEVKRLKDAKADVLEQCKGFNEWEEDLHRKALLETPGLDKASTMCHTMQLDSKGFVKLLKRKSSIQTRECRTVSVFPMKHFALIHAPHVPAHVFTNFGYRGALKHKLRPLVPRTETILPGPAMSLSHKTVSDMIKDFGKTPSDAAQVMAESYLPYDRAQLNKIVPGAYFVALLHDPVDHFVRIWNAVVANSVAAQGVTMADYLNNADRYMSSEFQQLKNPQMRNIFGVGWETQSASREYWTNDFQLVLVSDMFLESMIMLRRVLCWNRDQLIHPNVTLRDDHDVANSTLDVDDALAAKIRTVNKHDHKLYEDAKRDLTQEIKKELAWEEEIIELTQWVKEARSVCPTYTVGMSQEDLAKEIPNTVDGGKDMQLYPLNKQACALHAIEQTTFHYIFSKLYPPSPPDKLGLWPHL